MATERLAPDVLLASTNLSGVVGDISDDPDSPDANWLIASNNNTNTDVRVGYPNPTDNPTVGSGLQEFRALVRQFDTGQTGTPTVRIELWENGILIRAGSEINVGTTDQILSFTWNANEIATVDGSLVECLIVGTKTGGGTGKRNTVDVGAIEWNVEYTVAGEEYFGSLIQTGSGLLTLIGRKSTDVLVLQSGPSAINAIQLAAHFGTTQTTSLSNLTAIPSKNILNLVSIAGAGGLSAQGVHAPAYSGSGQLSAQSSITGIPRKNAASIILVSKSGIVSASGTVQQAAFGAALVSGLTNWTASTAKTALAIAISTAINIVAATVRKSISVSSVTQANGALQVLTLPSRTLVAGITASSTTSAIANSLRSSALGISGQQFLSLMGAKLSSANVTFTATSNILIVALKGLAIGIADVLALSGRLKPTLSISASSNRDTAMSGRFVVIHKLTNTT